MYSPILNPSYFLGACIERHFGGGRSVKMSA